MRRGNLFRVVRSTAALVMALAGAAACGSGPNPIQPLPNPRLELSCPSQVVRDATGPQGTEVDFDAPSPTGGRGPYDVNCTPRSATTFAIGETIVSCTATDADNAQAACEFTVRVRIPQTIARTKYVAFGDSITEGAVSLVPFITLATPDTYPAKLEESLRRRYPVQEIIVINRGFGGEQTTRGATRLPAVLDADRPEVVLILEGVNASWRLSVDSQAEAIRSMILAAQQRRIDVILATVMAVTPEWEARGHQGALERIKQLNARIKQMAAQYQLGSVVDLYAIFEANLHLLGSDGLHPTADGQTRIAEAFGEEIVRRYHVPAIDPDEDDSSAVSSRFTGRSR